MIYQHSYWVAISSNFSANCVILDVFLKRPVAEGVYLWENPRIRHRKEQNAILFLGIAQNCGKHGSCSLGAVRLQKWKQKNQRKI